MKGKNLFDISYTIKKYIEYIDNHNNTVISIQINEYTMKYFKKIGKYGFRIAGRNIPIIVNNYLDDFIVQFDREKNMEATEYVPYKNVKGVEKC